MDEWTRISSFGFPGSGTCPSSVGREIPARSSMAFSAAFLMPSPIPISLLLCSALTVPELSACLQIVHSRHDTEGTTMSSYHPENDPANPDRRAAENAAEQPDRDGEGEETTDPAGSANPDPLSGKITGLE